MELIEYLETADLARRTDLTPARIRQLVKLGVIKPSAMTVRGLRLFLSTAVDDVLRRRRAAEREYVE